jgi:hypothetical protein
LEEAMDLSQDNRNIHFKVLNRDATGLKAQSYILLKKEKDEY